MIPITKHVYTFFWIKCNLPKYRTVHKKTLFQFNIENQKTLCVIKEFLLQR